jgi:hypothetical protein
MAYRGRSARYPAPPAQTRTCSIPASGSSVVLAFASCKMIFARVAILCSEVGLGCSSPTYPAQVSCTGCVVPSGPSRCGGLSPPLSTLPDKTPRGHAAVTCLPNRWSVGKTLGSSLVSFPSFLIRASLTVYLGLAVPSVGTHRGFPSSTAFLVLHATA